MRMTLYEIGFVTSRVEESYKEEEETADTNTMLRGRIIPHKTLDSLSTIYR